MRWRVGRPWRRGPRRSGTAGRGGRSAQRGDFRIQHAFGAVGLEVPARVHVGLDGLAEAAHFLSCVFGVRSCGNQRIAALAPVVGGKPGARPASSCARRGSARRRLPSMTACHRRRRPLRGYGACRHAFAGYGCRVRRVRRSAPAPRRRAPRDRFSKRIAPAPAPACRGFRCRLVRCCTRFNSATMAAVAAARARCLPTGARQKEINPWSIAVSLRCSWRETI